MKTQIYTNYLLNQEATQVVEDIHWNNVEFLLRLDYTNPKGKPFYRDFSKYLRPVIYNNGDFNKTAATSLQIIDNNSDKYIDPGNDVDAYVYFDNSLLRNQLITNLNSNTHLRYQPDFLYSLSGGLDPILFGTDDFTIEVSFYATTLNVPWKYQTIVAQGSPLYYSTWQEPATLSLVQNNYQINSTSSDGSSNSYGWGIIIENDDLIFIGSKTKYIIVNNISANTWYNVCVERVSGVLKTYINGNLTNSYSNHTTNYNLGWANTDCLNQRLSIACLFLFLQNDFGTYRLTNKYNHFASFTGGISNVRITNDVARYTQDVYTVKLPHPVYSTLQPDDSNHSNVIFYLNSIYDYFDYGTNNKHLNDRNLLSTIPNLQYPYLKVSNNIYQTDLSTTLASNWTLEYQEVWLWGDEIIKNQHSATIYNTMDYIFNTVLDSLQEIFTSFVADAYTDYAFNIPVLELTTSDGKKILKLEYKFQKYGRSYSPNGNLIVYLSLKLSNDGVNWNTYSTDINQKAAVVPDAYLSNDDIKLRLEYLYNNGFTIPKIDANQARFISYYSEVSKSIVIQKSGNFLYFLIDGQLHRTINLTGNLYSVTNDLRLIVGGYSDSIPIRTYLTLPGQTTADYYTRNLDFGLKGLKLTNSAVYSTSENLATFYKKIIQNPIKLPASKKPPSRAQVISIVKKDTSSLVSTSSVSWYVYVTQDVTNLNIDDFGLTSIGDLTGASIESITKINTFLYEVTATTGTGDGSLQLNFIDDGSVTYPDNTSISYYPGELNLQGEAYIVRKSNPTPFLYSGSSPYVNEPFYVNVKFDSAIATFDLTKVATSNCRANKVEILNALEGLYRLTIEITSYGPIVVQLLNGAGISDTALPSVPSNVFTRIAADRYVILQLPLTSATLRNDYSPSRLLLDYVVVNNDAYSAEAPTGVTSSLSVNSVTETSGYQKLDFNANSAASTINGVGDWTIEWYMRINSTSKKAHIFSIDNGSSGFCVMCDNTNFYLTRNYTQQSKIFSTMSIKDKETTSYIAWGTSGYSNLQLFPHFAITKQGDVYRVYRNGIRQFLIQSTTNIDPRQGELRVGYYKNSITDAPYLLSNIRITYGVALYTAYQFNVPSVPYPVPDTLSEVNELLSYIAVYGDNTNIVKTGNTITIHFYSIIDLNLEDISVTLNSNQVTVSKEDYNSYKANYLVTEQDVTGYIEFNIDITSSLYPDKSFTQTTDGSRVYIDNDDFNITITTDIIDVNAHRIPITITSIKDIPSLSYSDFTLVNGSLSNLSKTSNNNEYTALLTALNSGVVTISIAANTITDLAGNYNLASNTLNRTAVVPAIVSDPYWNNVITLIQITANNISELSSNLTIDTNCLISTDTAPTGVAYSLYFDGVSNYLSIDTEQTMPSNIDYTVELFVYPKSNSFIKLNTPIALPASNISSSSFQANWTKNNSVTAEYYLDVAYDSLFTNKLVSYNGYNTGDSSSLFVDDVTFSIIPKIKSTYYRNNISLISAWDYEYPDIYGYRLDVALDSNFTQKLYSYNNKFTKNSFLSIENDENSNYFSATVDLGETVTVNNSDPAFSNTIFSSILDNDSYPALLYFYDESTVRFYTDNGYQYPLVDYIAALSWTHLALVNKDGVLTLYINGKESSTSKSVGFSSVYNLGSLFSKFYGYMNGFRITKGVARYDTDFVAPNLPFPTYV